MLSNEARNLLVKTYEQMPDAVEVGEIFSGQTHEWVTH